MFFNSRIDVRITDPLSEWLVKDKDLKFFGEIALATDIIETKRVPTMGVCITKTGFNLYYNPLFLDKLTPDGVKFVLIHEFMHLLSEHCLRSSSYGLDPHLSNCAQDMIINTEINRDYASKKITMPTGEMSGLLIPPDYKDIHISEVLYDYLKSDEFKKKNPELSDRLGDGEGLGQEFDCSDMSDEEIEELIDKLLKSGRYDVHLKNEVSDDVAKEMSRSLVQSLKTRGLLPSSMEEFLNKITPSKVDYLKRIKKSVSGFAGSVKYDTYLKLNRRGIEGKKGFKRDGVGINVLLDVSGSMNGMHEKVLSYCFQNNLYINLVQVDTEVKNEDVFKITNKNELQKMKLIGGGGTNLQPGIDFITANPKLNKLGLLILTDGDCDSLDVRKINGKTLIISCRIEVNVKGDNVEQIIIDKND